MLSKLFGKKSPDLSPLKELSTEEFEQAKFKARVAFIDDEEIEENDISDENGINVEIDEENKN